MRMQVRTKYSIIHRSTCYFADQTNMLHRYQTHTLSLFLLSKQSHLVKKHSPSQAQLNGIYCLVDSDIPNLLLHLKQRSKPISSDLCTNLQYLLDGACVWVCVCTHECVCKCVCMYVSVCVCVYVCVCTHACLCTHWSNYSGICSWCSVWIFMCVQCYVRVV